MNRAVVRNVSVGVCAALMVAPVGVVDLVAEAAGETITTIPLAAGSIPEAVAVAPDGTAYSVNRDTGTLSRIPAGSALPVQNLPTGGDQPYSAAVLSNGDVFVTNRSTDTIARIRPGVFGVPRLYPVGREPWGITATPDDTVYATTLGADTIVRINRGSVIVNSTIPLLAGSQPKDIAFSTIDRRLYVANSATGTVGRVNPVSGAVQYLPLPAGAEPRGVAVAEDGSVYVTDIGLGAVHWFRPGADTVSRTTILAGVTFPSDVAAAADGSVLVALYDTSRLQRFRNGAPGETIELGAGRGPDRVAVGPDGTAYTADFSGDSVSRIEFPAPPPPDLGTVTTLKPQQVRRHKAKLLAGVTTVDQATTVRIHYGRNRALTRKSHVVQVRTVQAGRTRTLKKKIVDLRRHKRYWFRVEGIADGTLLTGNVRRFRTR